MDLLPCIDYLPHFVLTLFHAHLHGNMQESAIYHINFEIDSLTINTQSFKAHIERWKEIQTGLHTYLLTRGWPITRKNHVQLMILNSAHSPRVVGWVDWSE